VIPCGVVRDEEDLLSSGRQRDGRESGSGNGLVRVGRGVSDVGMHQFPQEGTVIGTRDVDLVVDDREDAVDLVLDEIQHVLAEESAKDKREGKEEG
jgi:hypothetical protein